MWKNIVTLVFVAPMLALFGGLGILAYSIGSSWDARNTDSVIAGMIAICGTVTLLISFGVVGGFFLLVRLRQQERQLQSDYYPQQHHQLQAPPQVLPPQPPPMIEQQGSWQSNGQASYNVWEQTSDQHQADW